MWSIEVWIECCKRPIARAGSRLIRSATTHVRRWAVWLHCSPARHCPQAWGVRYTRFRAVRACSRTQFTYPSRHPDTFPSRHHGTRTKHPPFLGLFVTSTPFSSPEIGLNRPKVVENRPKSVRIRPESVRKTPDPSSAASSARIYIDQILHGQYGQYAKGPGTGMGKGPAPVEP